MSRSANSARNRALLATAAVVLAGAATAYYYFTSSRVSSSAAPADTTAPTAPHAITKSTRHIAILVTQLLGKYPNAVLLLAPDLADLAHPRLLDQVPTSERYRLIRCESYKGALHVLKHLRPALALLPPADVCGIAASDLDNFVQQTDAISDESIARLFAA